MVEVNTAISPATSPRTFCRRSSSSAFMLFKEARSVRAAVEFSLGAGQGSIAIFEHALQVDHPLVRLVQRGILVRQRLHGLVRTGTHTGKFGGSLVACRGSLVTLGRRLVDGSGEHGNFGHTLVEPGAQRFGIRRIARLGLVKLILEQRQLHLQIGHLDVARLHVGLEGSALLGHLLQACLAGVELAAHVVQRALARRRRALELVRLLARIGQITLSLAAARFQVGNLRLKGLVLAPRRQPRQQPAQDEAEHQRDQ